MLSLFKRYRLSRTSVPQLSVFTFLTACARIKPMSQAEFEFAQHSLDVASDWLYQQRTSPNYADGGHLVLASPSDPGYQEVLSRQLALNSMPVVLANCHELLLNAMPALTQENEDVGIIHIGHRFELKQTLDPQLGSVYHFALSRFSNTRLFCIGIDAERVPSQTWEYAEDLGCDWLTEEECRFRNRSQLKSQLSHYIDHCDQLVLSVDLASLVPSHELDESKILDIQLVLRAIRQAVQSGKVKLIQLVGSKDKLIYSRQTKDIVEELCNLSADATQAY